jgi:hypothetical protein
VASEAFAGHLPGADQDPLEAALLVAARAGDAATVAKLTELIHAKLRGGNVTPIDAGRARRRR